jgi:hypothetical protein
MTTRQQPMIREIPPAGSLRHNGNRIILQQENTIASASVQAQAGWNKQRSDAGDNQRITGKCAGGCRSTANRHMIKEQPLWNG